MELNIDATGLGNAIADISKLTGLSVEQVLKSEVTAVMTATVNRTKKATVSKIKAAYAKMLLNSQKSFLDKTSNIWLFIRTKAASRKLESSIGGAMAYDKTSHKTYSLNWKLKDAVWSRIMQANVARAQWQAKPTKKGLTAKQRIEAIGLSARSWFDPAAKAGLIDESKVKYLSRIKTAHAGSRPTSNGTIEPIVINGRTTGYRIINAAWSIGQDKYTSAVWAFETSLHGREQYYNTNLQKGVFNSIKTVAARYKGLNIR